VNVVAGSNVTATSGNLSATAGDVTAGRNIIAASNITATTGNISIPDGRLILNSGNTGIASLGSGTAIIVDTYKKLYVTASNCKITSQVFLTHATLNNPGILSSEEITDGQFRIVSTNSNDGGSVRWLVVN